MRNRQCAHWATLAALVTVSAIAACSSEDPSAPRDARGPQEEENPAAPGTASAPGGAGVKPGDGDPNVGGFSNAPLEPSEPGPSAVRRLNADEYARTVRDLFPGYALPSLTIPSDGKVLGFDNNVTVQGSSDALVAALETVSRSVADAVSANPAKLTGCAPTAPAQEETCVRTFLASFGKRAFRRPMSLEEAERFVAFYKRARAGDPSKGLEPNDHAAGLGMLVSAFLQSPQFLFRLELGDGAVDAMGAIPLSQYELASRLSYFLWRSMPDDALLAAADAKKLSDPVELEKQARRMLSGSEPRARETVANFFQQWLGEAMSRDQEPDFVKDSPEYNPALGKAMRDETRMFVDHVVWDKQGSLHALLTSNETYANGPLAQLYGATVPNPSAMQLVTLNPAQRAGLLTQGSFLAGRGHRATSAPVLRGTFVLFQLLCQPIGAPPANVDLSPPTPGAPGLPKTTRGFYEQTTAAPACAGCHGTVNNVGFGFENYDALGKWRSAENGEAIDASGKLPSGAAYTGAVALAQNLSADPKVHECMTQQWFRFNFGRQEAKSDIGTLQAANAAFKKKSHDIRELALSFITTKAFTHRRAVAQ